MTTAEAPAPVDPRVQRSREAILRATAELLVESGYAGVTIEGVAERASVAKTTIYRHWRSRSQLIFDAFESMLQPQTGRRPLAGDLRARLIMVLEGLIRGVTNSAWAPAVASMVEAGDRDEEVRQLVHDWLAERMVPFRAILEAGVDSGELRRSVDLDVAVSTLAGPIFYRRLVSREPLGPAFAETVVDQFLAGAKP